MIKKKISLIALTALISLSGVLPALAQSVSFYEVNADFNPSMIISDTSLTDYNSMTIEQIREFVTEKGGTLGTYIDPIMQVPAYYVIWQAAQEFGINPKFILTMLQKEQSLVTDNEPTQNQYNWAVGYSCYGGICLDKYKGFSVQIRAMANKFINDYLVDLNTEGLYKNNFYCTFTKWCVGDAKETQDYQLIIPANKVTAALYTYNPYRGGTIVDGYKIGANYNFWKIWHNWFEQSVYRPNGSLLKSSTGDTVYLIQDRQKRPFANFSALVTRYDPSNIITVSQTELDQYPLGAEIKFSQYSLLRNESGDIFLLVDDSLRKIASMEVFKTLGFNPEEVEQVENSDLSGFATGEEITLASAYPTGALIKDNQSGGVYYVESGVKYPIFSREIMQVNFPKWSVLTVASDQLEKFPKGEAVKFKDGTLVKSADSDVVYVIAGGKKLPIADGNAFVSRGYSWNKIITTSEAALNIHPTGETLEYLDTSLLKDSTNESPEILENTEEQVSEPEQLIDNSYFVETN